MSAKNNGHIKLKEKKTIRFYAVIRDFPQDFGLGPGVISRNEIEFTDDAGHGFKTLMFGFKLEDQKERILNECFRVICEERVGKRGWNRDPQGINKGQNHGTKRTSKRRGSGKDDHRG